MSITFIREPEEGQAFARHLAGAGELALDLEAAGFHRYSDRLCLVQVSTRDGTWVLDPLAFDVREALRPTLEDPEIRIVMHGADFDLRLLDRDLDIHLRGLFDTQAAASLLGETSLGLASLLEKHLDVRLGKQHQRADWAQRPLPDELVEYAADDTRHLLRLADLLRERLEAEGRLAWARNEFRSLEGVSWDEDEEDEDPVTGVKGARDLEPRELARLREALEWRDGIARERDRAPFRIAGDRALLEAAVRRPASADELASVRGLSPVLVRARGNELLERFRRVDERDEASLRPYPSRKPDRSRPPPEVQERAARLRSARNRRAEELGIDRGTLLPNATLEEIARRIPRSREALERIPGVKEWQVEAAGDAVLSVLTGEEAA